MKQAILVQISFEKCKNKGNGKHTYFTKAVFTLQVLMHRSILCPYLIFLAHLFTFTLDTTGIRNLCLH